MTQDEIDEIVIAEAGDDLAWEEPVQVQRPEAALQLPADLMARAAFLAKLHRTAEASS